MSFDKKLPVSVIVPCFCCGKTIRRALASVVNQSQTPVEVILVDDSSHDDTWEILTELAQAHLGWVKILRLEQNQGAASARNAGWALATQPYIAFLDADDAWHPQKIEIQYAYMNANPEVVLSGHGYRLLKQKNELPHWEITSFETRNIRKWRLILSNKFVTPSVMLQRNVAQRFVEKQRYMEDHMLWLKIICSGARVVKISAELAAIYKEPFGVTGLSAQVWLMERGDLGNYYRLYNEKFIKGYQFIALGIYSVLKYIRRLIIYSSYLRWKK